MTERTFWRLLLGVTLGALILRILYVVLVLEPLPLPDNFDNVSHLPFRPFDEMYYSTGARALAEGRFFRFKFLGPTREQAYLPPLTSIVLSPVALVSDALLPMRIVGALGGTALVALLGLLGRMADGPRVGIAAAVLAAVYPNLWMNDGLLLAETWAGVATALALLATYHFLKHRTAGRAVLIGLACGVATLARSELALLVPLLGVYLLVSLRSSSRSERLVYVGALAGAAVLVLAPWVTYNVARFERPVLFTTGIGDVMLGANCPTTYYGDRIGFTDSVCPLLSPADPATDPSIVAGEHRRLALEYMRGHLSRLPLVVVAREGRVWSLYAPGHMANELQSNGRPTWASHLGLAMYWCLVPLAVVGALMLRRSRRPLFPLLVPIVIVAVNAALFYGFVRYRVPAETSLVVLAGVAIGRWKAMPGTESSPARAPISRQE